jgi:hypothetical protein
MAADAVYGQYLLELPGSQQKCGVAVVVALADIVAMAAGQAAVDPTLEKL